jgi:beta-barrel assembly-enhancing protease
MKRTTALQGCILAVTLLLAAGCAEVVQVGTTAGAQMGTISTRDKELIDQTATGVAGAVRPMTEEEEYYLGRAVAATILSQYRLVNDERRTAYLNRVGNAVALASHVPFVYGGYHFAILAAEEVNALSCPGGTILVTEGMLKRARNEEELAAVLAHEIAHVNHRDGVKAVQSSRWVEAATAIGTGAAGKLGSAELAKITSLFEGSVNDVFKMLVVNGYSREQEMEADRSALAILHRAGYDPHGLADYLARLAQEQQGGKQGAFFSTHPGMADRLTAVRATIAENSWRPIDHTVRDGRFAAFR